ncbi:MAG: hypothetical protein QGD92_07135 [Gammaproteobacteria bacterium]|nr:hypothetical protein [Gammaproteobacteria bacterium]
MHKVIITTLTTLLLTSCIFYHYDGTDAYRQSVSLERGVTTVDWVYDHLGHPLSRHKKTDGSEILHYQFHAEEETRVHLFLIINIHSKERKSSDLFIEIRDGIVEDYWQD